LQGLKRQIFAVEVVRVAQVSVSATVLFVLRVAASQQNPVLVYLARAETLSLHEGVSHIQLYYLPLRKLFIQNLADFKHLN